MGAGIVLFADSCVCSAVSLWHLLLCIPAHSAIYWQNLVHDGLSVHSSTKFEKLYMYLLMMLDRLDLRYFSPRIH